MASAHEHPLNFFRKVWTRVSHAIAAEAPEEYSNCAFLCHQPECRRDHWNSCTMRLSPMLPSK